MKTKLFIDLDETLFDTLRFKKKLYEIFERTGASKDQIDKSYKEECADFEYAPEDNLRRLRAICEFDFEAAMASLEDIYSFASECLYQDSVLFLEGVDREKYEVNLLSFGDINFQREKFIHLGIEQYFDNAYYCNAPKWEYLDTVVEPDEKFLMIDDRADTMREIAKKFPNAIPIKISRYDEIKDAFSARENFDGAKVENLMQSLSYL